VLRTTDNSNNNIYDKGLVAEVSKFLFGEGFAVAGGDQWRVRRRAVSPSLHRCVSKWQQQQQQPCKVWTSSGVMSCLALHSIACCLVCMSGGQARGTWLSKFLFGEGFQVLVGTSGV
jgi:hypothetical protein